MKMIDIAEKERTSRVAIARAELRCSRETLKLLNEGRLEKGDALAAARLAGIMAAKRTPDILPLCHPIVLAGADVDVACDESAGVVRIVARIHAVERTGVEMEALTAAMAAALTLWRRRSPSTTWPSATTAECKWSRCGWCTRAAAARASGTARTKRPSRDPTSP